MTKKEILESGRDNGYNIASWIDLPEIGSPIDKCIDWIGLGDVVTKNNVADYFEILCHAAEDNSRQYSDFSFLAHDLNEIADQKPYDVWEVYDEGVSKGISDNWKERKAYYN